MRVNLDVPEVHILIETVKQASYRGEDAPKVAKLLSKLTTSLAKGVAEMNKNNSGEIVSPDGSIPPNLNPVGAN